MELKDLGTLLLVGLDIVVGLLAWAFPDPTRRTKVIGISVCLGLFLIAALLGNWEPGVSPKQAEQAETDRVAGAKQAEAETLSKLVAGVTVSSFRGTLGQGAPDYRFCTSCGMTREVYVRDYDYVQAWVDRNQDVAAFSVTIRTTDFHPAFRFGEQTIVLGQDSIAKVLGASLAGGPYALGGGCGHAGHYYEAFGEAPPSTLNSQPLASPRLAPATTGAHGTLCATEKRGRDYANATSNSFLATPEIPQIRTIPLVSQTPQ
jgi:hypothetical protein